MKQTLYIHVGAGKTGTTAIQDFLYLNKSLLSDKGIYIPEEGNIHSDGSIAHHKLSAWGAHRSTDVWPLWKSIASSKSKKILLTSEYFHSRISAKDGSLFFEKINTLFSNFNIKIIFYIRRQDQWIQSVYEQWVKSGSLRTGQTIEEFVDAYKNNLPDQLLKFSSVFGKENIIVRVFEKSQFKDGNIFSDFFGALNVELPNNICFPEKNSNSRLSPDALHFKSISNSVCKDVKTAQVLSKPLLDYSTDLYASDSQRIHHSHGILSKNTQKKIYEANKEKYSEIAKNYLGRESGELFLDEPSFLEEEFKYTNENTVKISSYLFTTLFKRISLLEKENKAMLKKIDSISTGTTFKGLFDVKK
ncbi:hypothetical protein [Shewanella donghaensis]|uniref:hypothetical protein n=1 Tax=Shewanella donghaensis TaxID=238836 RepID=UPI0011824C78|nr:hypothetical protein [Shewanella donghaensis]